MATEEEIKQRESGGHPFVGYGGVDLSSAPLNQYGFPIWSGRMGPAGISHAAGLYQFEPKTWAEGASALGVSDFSPASQKKVYDWTRAKYGEAPWAASAPGGTAAAALGRKRLGADAFASSYEPSQGGLKSGLQLLNFLSQQNQQDQAPDSGQALLQSLVAETQPAQEQPQAQAAAEKPPQATPPTPLPEDAPQKPDFIEPPGPTTPPPTPRFGQPQQPQQAPAQPPSRGLQLLQQLTQQGDPEAAGAAATSQAMEPATTQLLQRPNLAGAIGMQPVGEQILEAGQREQEARQSGQGLLQQILASAASPFAGSIGPGVIGGMTRGVPPRIEPSPLRAEPGGGRPAQPPVGAGVPAAQAPPPAAGPAFAMTAPELVPGGAGRGGALPPEPPEPPIPGKREVVKLAQSLDDDLFKLQQTSQAEMIEARQMIEGLPREWLNPEVQERAYHERESRMTMKGASEPKSAMTQDIERALAPLDSQIHDDATWIRNNAADVARELPDLPTAEEGYVHRKVVGRNIPGERLDPNAQDIITGGGGRSLSRRASGIMHRDQAYVLQDNAGNREFQKNPNGSPALLGQRKASPNQYGETIQDYKTGKRYVVSEPTTAELEANVPGRQYNKNLVANTTDNFLRLRRVRRNIELLNEWKPRLEASGHFFPEGKQANPPKGFQFVELPQLRGWAEPHIASVLNDFYRTQSGGIQGFLERANHFLIGTMFALPVRHIQNVGAHYVVGRGFDWLYSNPMLAQATREVASQGPQYLRYLKAGAGLRYPSTLNENFYGVLLEKMFQDQMKSPWWKEIAKGVFAGDPKMAGAGIADMVKAEYAWSRRALWKVNDVFLTARIMELEKQGLPMERAIQQAEKEIPNYRIPSEVMRSPFISGFLKSPYVAFGRYSYGRARALSEMIKDMVGKEATGEERMRAIGQATVLALLGTGGYQVANAALNMALQQMGMAGDKPMEVSGFGPFGIMRTGGQYLAARFGLAPDQIELTQALATLITASPMSGLIGEFASGGKQPFTGQPEVDPYASPLGKTVQTGEAMARQLYPLQVGMDIARKGLLPALGPSALGIKQEYAGPPGKVQRRLRRGAARREARDPIEQFTGSFFQ